MDDDYIEFDGRWFRVTKGFFCVDENGNVLQSDDSDSEPDEWEQCEEVNVH